MKQDSTEEHKSICIDPVKFEDRLTPTEDGKYIFNVGDVPMFLIDQLNAAGVDIAITRSDHTHAIEYHHWEHSFKYEGHWDDFSKAIGSFSTPKDAVITGMVVLSDILDSYEGVMSWVSYKDGKHCLHIQEITTPENEEKPEAATLGYAQEQAGYVKPPAAPIPNPRERS